MLSILSAFCETAKVDMCGLFGIELSNKFSSSLASSSCGQCKNTNIHAQILHFKPCNWVKMGNYFKRESQGPLGHMFNCSCSPLTASFSSPWSATAVSVAVVIRHGSFTSVGEQRRRWWRCHRQCSTEVQHQNRAANDLYHSCSLLLSDAMLT